MKKKNNLNLLMTLGITFAISCLALTNAKASHPYISKNAVKNISVLDTATKDSVFTKVDKQPSFPGGQKLFDLYVAKNMQYPQDMLDKEIEGRVTLQFIVEPDGTITDIKALKGPGRGSSEEAVRIMKRSPKWVPGYKDGNAVRVLFKTPVNFTIKTGQDPRNSDGPMKVSNGG